MFPLNFYRSKIPLTATNLTYKKLITLFLTLTVTLNLTLSWYRQQVCLRISRGLVLAGGMSEEKVQGGMFGSRMYV